MLLSRNQLTTKQVNQSCNRQSYLDWMMNWSITTKSSWKKANRSVKSLTNLNLQSRSIWTEAAWSPAKDARMLRSLGACQKKSHKRKLNQRKIKKRYILHKPLSRTSRRKSRCLVWEGGETYLTINLLLQRRYQRSFHYRVLLRSLPRYQAEVHTLSDHLMVQESTTVLLATCHWRTLVMLI